ncbi:MAG: glutaredoxin 3 [Cyanobacteria bacterium QS_8_64_29]|nr:MAG: glutaredoxin 3 [Cyanobacteria bacterium QS_8_64_29]
MIPLLRALFARRAEPPPAEVEIYTWQMCPFCWRAKLLLGWKGVRATEYKIDGDERARTRMAERAGGRRTLPQIFVNGQAIGGCDELYTLNGRGQLDGLLAQPPSAPPV